MKHVFAISFTSAALMVGLLACSSNENSGTASGGSAGTVGGSGGTAGSSDGGTGGGTAGSAGIGGGTAGSSGSGGSGGQIVGNVVGVAGIAAFDQLSAADQTALKQTKTLFMHMSVGSNLTSGQDHSDAPWVAGTNSLGYVFDTVEDSGDFSSTVFGEAFFGQNGEPKQKTDMFQQFVNTKQIGKAVKVAGMKFCYTDLEVDEGGGQDLNVVQQNYAAMMTAIRSANPGLKFFHITTPLQPADQYHTVENNSHRKKFGDWLKSTYSSQDIVFDLQEVESTDNSGGKCLQSGTPVVCSAWAGDDDGHLNDVGSTRAARAFLYAIHMAAK